MGTEDALVFTTGHQANVGTLGTILAPGDTVIADSADHASILDGCLLSRAKLRPFRHGRLDKLEKQLERAPGDGGGVLVVVDGVFSMEGDVAPLPGDRRPAPAATARGSWSTRRTAPACSARAAPGASELLGVEDRVDLRMGTFSKSLASCGGFIAGPADVIDYLRTHSRAFLFTASNVPAALGSALAALRIVRSDEGRVLMDQRARQRRSTCATGCARSASRSSSTTGRRRPVIPVLVEDDWKAVLLWRALYDAGVYVNVAHPSGRAAGRRAAAHERHGDARRRRPSTARSRPSRRSSAAFEAEHGAAPDAVARRCQCWRADILARRARKARSVHTSASSRC